MKDKSKFFKLIGSRSAEKLVENSHDLVVGLPDLYPNQVYEETRYRHSNLSEIQSVQRKLVEAGLHEQFKARDLRQHMDRFYPCALKHDLEMLLLASEKHLQSRLGTKQKGSWTKPPENQNQNKPPKRVVEDLFMSHLKRAYRETRDAPAILRNASLREVVADGRGTAKCPAFQEMLDWVGEKTNVPAY